MLYLNGDFSEYFEEKSTQKLEKIVKKKFSRSAQITLEINVLFKWDFGKMVIRKIEIRKIGFRKNRHLENWNSEKWNSED